MAHHKSAIKRIQTNARDNLRNKMAMSALKTQVKKVREAQNKENGAAEYKKASSMLDKLVIKGKIHKNKAANQKSRLATVVNNLE